MKKARKQEKKYVKKHGPIGDKKQTSLIASSPSTTGHLIDDGDVVLGDELGDGSFGVVCEGVWTSGGKKIKVNLLHIIHLFSK